MLIAEIRENKSLVVARQKYPLLISGCGFPVLKFWTLLHFLISLAGSNSKFHTSSFGMSRVITHQARGEQVIHCLDWSGWLHIKYCHQNISLTISGPLYIFTTFSLYLLYTIYLDLLTSAKNGV